MRTRFLLLNMSILSGLALLLPMNLPCQAAAKELNDNTNNSRAASNDTADSATRMATVKQLWSKYQRLGIAALSKKNPDLALEMFAQAVQEAEMPNFSQADLALSLDSIANVYAQLGKTQDSLKAAKKAYEIRNRLAGNSKDLNITGQLRMGDLYMEMGDYAHAKPLFQQALQLAESTPAGDGFLPRIMDSLLSLSLSTHDQAGAKIYLSKLLTYDERHAADENSANHLEQYARILWQEGRLSEASKSLSKALSIRNSCQAPDDADAIALCRNLVRANLMLGGASAPEKEISKVLSYDRAHLAPNAPDYLFDLLSLATIKLNRGEMGRRQLCEEVLKAEKESKDANSLDLADASSLLARICAAENQWFEAKNLANQALTIRQNLALPEVLSVYDIETLARVAAAQQETQDAEINFQKALSIRLERLTSDQAGLTKVKEGLQLVQDQVAKAKNDNHLSARLESQPQ